MTGPANHEQGIHDAGWSGYTYGSTDRLKKDREQAGGRLQRTARGLLPGCFYSRGLV